ncbi:MAG: hypothetical protein KIT33_10320 [Candidatus Kapabacteria bacterium]|nr:hypothetical protein [Ignavibacteriota bacterium]MCW5885353.1 hypothetical protein [Candidatus Kapabacteria bacterium]
MKKEVKKVQNKIENSETEKPEEIIVSSEEKSIVPTVIEVTVAETKPVVDNANAPSDIDVKDAETKPVVDNVNAPSVNEPKDAKPIADDKEADTKPVVDNAVLNKQKIKALKRSIENKELAIEREEKKVKEWRVQAADRDKLAKELFDKKKSALEELLKKNQEKFNKSVERTQKLWYSYSDNYELTKIKKLKDDLALLQAELLKFDTEPTETK